MVGPIDDPSPGSHPPIQRGASLSPGAFIDNNDDCDALIALDGALSIWAPAMRGTSYCGWPGVTCASAASGARITRLALAAKAASPGALPQTSIGSMTSLQVRRLQNHKAFVFSCFRRAHGSQDSSCSRKHSCAPALTAGCTACRR